MKEIPITSLMSTDIELIPGSASLRSIIRIMQSRRQSCCLIGENGVPAGIVTERDLIKVMETLIQNPELGEQAVDGYMTAPVHTLHANQTLFDALVVSRAERVRHLPVVDDNETIVGLVTQTDLADAHFHVIELQRTLIERAIEDRTEELRDANRELQMLSMEDALLGIGNRRSMEVDMEHTHSLAMRYERPYTLALLDVDYFKKYNDHYGHQAGDTALQEVTRVIQDAIRKSDRLYRYGGEEFLLLLPDTTADGGRILIDRLIENLFSKRLPHEPSQYGFITMSAGLADFRNKSSASESWESIVKRADEALYRAKETGRNRAA